MKDVNNTVTTENGAEVYTDKILEYLDEFAANEGIKDWTDASQSRWNAALIYVNFNYFKKNPKILKSKDYVNKVPSVPTMKTNNNAYDLDIVYNICELYTYLCYRYEKEISIMGFSKLTGIDYWTLTCWGDNTARSNSKAQEICKKLVTDREETLSDRLYTGGVNPVGILGILNRHYGWNMGQPRGQQAQQGQSLEDIQARYKGLSTSTGPALPPPDIVINSD